MPLQHKKQSATSAFISGACGGISLVAVAHPFDLIKVRMQSTSLRSSTLTAARNIITNNGFKGLYQGVTPVLAGTPPMLAINLWAYHQSQKLIHQSSMGCKDFEGVHQLSLLEVGCAGALAAIPTSILVAPAEQIKIRLQLGDGKSNAFNIIQSIIRKSGYKGLFRGSILTLCRDGPGSFFYFMTYECITRHFHDRFDRLPIYAVLFAGGMSGIVNWTIAIPIDTLKTRIQSQSSVGLSLVIKKLMIEDGVRGLFRGLRPTLLRAFPASAAFFCGVELSGRVMNKHFDL